MPSKVAFTGLRPPFGGLLDLQQSDDEFARRLSRCMKKALHLLGRTPAQLGDICERLRIMGPRAAKALPNAQRAVVAIAS